MTTKQKDLEQELESSGHAMRVLSGGPRYQTYFTPSGKKVRGLPSIREYVYTDPDTGERETGTRDATPVQRGWLTSMPQVLMLDCRGCSKYHATQEEVEVCVVDTAELQRAMEEKGLEEHRQVQLLADPNTERIDALQGQVNSIIEGQDEMMALLKQALGAK